MNIRINTKCTSNAVKQICNTPGISCTYTPTKINTDGCGNTVTYVETVNINGMKVLVPCQK